MIVATNAVGLRLAVAACVLTCLVACGGDDDPAGGEDEADMRGASVSSPTLEGPITGGAGQPFIASTALDLGLAGYTQAEYFIAGDADAYVNEGPLTANGAWTVSPGETAAYKTRILVYRPIDPARFNGTVVVEWLNVSGGLDAAPDWTSSHVELFRRGAAWVGVSAQRVGVEGGPSLVGLPPRPLKTMDPERYGSLSHPGDSFSYAIFSQAGQAIRRPRGPSPLGDLRVERLIAAGESQSAFRLVTYIDAIQPRDDMYDGFLVHSRSGASSAPLSEAPQPAISVPARTLIRGDLDVPVLMFQTETDLILLVSAAVRQPDTERFRLWEVAGTAHADTYGLTVGSTDLGDSPDVARLVITTMPVPGISCPKPVNSGPQHWVLKAAVAALDDWITHGTPPPTAPLVDVNMAPLAIRRDAHGNALGGVRTPQVDVPIATLSGEGQVASILCLLFGTTVPFDEATLAALYPDAESYVAAFNEATDRALAAGFILEADAALMKAHAATVIGG